MQRAVEQITEGYDEIIIDGNINYLIEDTRSRAVIKADDTVPAVSAASIVAKVARDNYMAQIATEYPEYGFAQHKGYPTKKHVEALNQYGITAIHRLTFEPVKSMTQKTLFD